jgi:hypothetical protein
MQIVGSGNEDPGHVHPFDQWGVVLEEDRTAIYSARMNAISSLQASAMAGRRLLNRSKF